MIPIALFAALVIHTYDGQDRVITDIEPQACEMSRCMVLYGKPCGQVIAEGVKAEMSRRKEAADQAVWEAANPLTQKRCNALKASDRMNPPANGLYCGPSYGRWGIFGITTSISSTVKSVESTQSAMCIRQRGDQ